MYDDISTNNLLGCEVGTQQEAEEESARMCVCTACMAVVVWYEMTTRNSGGRGGGPNIYFFSPKRYAAVP